MKFTDFNWFDLSKHTNEELAEAILLMADGRSMSTGFLRKAALELAGRIKPDIEQVAIVPNLSAQNAMAPGSHCDSGRPSIVQRRIMENHGML